MSTILVFFLLTSGVIDIGLINNNHSCFRVLLRIVFHSLLLLNRSIIFVVVVVLDRSRLLGFVHLWSRNIIRINFVFLKVLLHEFIETHCTLQPLFADFDVVRVISADTSVDIARFRVRERNGNLGSLKVTTAVRAEQAGDIVTTLRAATVEIWTALAHLGLFRCQYELDW